MTTKLTSRRAHGATLARIADLLDELSLACRELSFADTQVTPKRPRRAGERASPALRVVATEMQSHKAIRALKGKGVP